MILDYIAANSYVRKLNNKDLKLFYLNLRKKNPKSKVDNILIDCCLKHLSKRGLLLNGFVNSKN